VNPRDRLSLAFSPDVLAALEEFVAERVAAEFAIARGSRSSGPTWLTLDQAADRLGCSRDAVRMRVNRGRLEHRRHGRRLYVSAASVDSLGRAA